MVEQYLARLHKNKAGEEPFECHTHKTNGNFKKPFYCFNLNVKEEASLSLTKCKVGRKNRIIRRFPSDFILIQRN